MLKDNGILSYSNHHVFLVRVVMDRGCYDSDVLHGQQVPNECCLPEVFYTYLYLDVLGVQKHAMNNMLNTAGTTKNFLTPTV